MCVRCVDRAVKVTGKTVVTLCVCVEYGMPMGCALVDLHTGL